MYCAIEDLKERYPLKLLTDCASETDELTQEAVEIIETAIKDSSAELDIYLYSYALSVPYPEIIVRLCAEMTINNLLKRVEAENESYSLRQKWIERMTDMLKREDISFASPGENKPERKTLFVSDPPRGW